MKKQFLLLGAATIFGFAACNDSATDSATKTDSTVTTQTNVEKKGMQIADFSTRTFMDLKTNKPVKLVWDTVHYYYVDETGNQAYYYYDPATKDTFDYWGRRLNSYITYSNGDYILDESALPPLEMTSTTSIPMDTSTMSTSSNSGDSKMKAKDDKFKEKTDTSKLKVKEDKIKVKNK